MISKSNTYTESFWVYVSGISVKVFAHYPGRSPALPMVLLSLRCDEMGQEKSAEVILRLSTITEGPNLKLSCRDFNCDVKGDVEKRVEILKAHYLCSRRNWRVG